MTLKQIYSRVRSWTRLSDLIHISGKGEFWLALVGTNLLRSDPGPDSRT